ncbi:hypothetical protein Taro_033684 [Colocasia esculenta]|uniref:Uncharacterized protein n=1 Tax=Colocasia esculenta TaxID=4460 RepID=A0A843VYK7_COLES|nr:hypothetical protein [Colocasia esculenta]
MRLLSHVVAPVFRKPLCLGECVPRVYFRIVLTPLVLRESVVASAFVRVPAALAGKGLLFEFIAYLIGLNSNPSGSSDPWVAARPSESLAVVREVGSLQWYQSLGSN